MQGKIIVGPRRSGKSTKLAEAYWKAESEGKFPLVITAMPMIQAHYAREYNIPKNRCLRMEDLDSGIRGHYECETLLIDEYFYLKLPHRAALDDLVPYYEIVATGTVQQQYNTFLLNLVKAQRKNFWLSNSRFHSMFTEVAPEVDFDEYWYNFLSHPAFELEELKHSFTNKELDGLRLTVAPARFVTDFLGTWRDK